MMEVCTCRQMVTGGGDGRGCGRRGGNTLEEGAVW